jgi:hypothetical protein
LRVAGAPLLDAASYTALVAVVILTTLITPPMLKWTLAGHSNARATRPAA